LTRAKQHSTSYSKLNKVLNNFTEAGRSGWYDPSSLAKHSGPLTRMGTMGITSPRLGRKEQGGLPRVNPLGLKAWARGPITEAV
jgi:hypothetical protein